jgi:hypothetical protein
MITCAVIMAFVLTCFARPDRRNHVLYQHVIVAIAVAVHLGLSKQSKSNISASVVHLDPSTRCYNRAEYENKRTRHVELHVVASIVASSLAKGSTRESLVDLKGLPAAATTCFSLIDTHIH